MVGWTLCDEICLVFLYNEIFISCWLYYFFYKMNLIGPHHCIVGLVRIARVVCVERGAFSFFSARPIGNVKINFQIPAQIHPLNMYTNTKTVG